jgi:hypothetical protein
VLTKGTAVAATPTAPAHPEAIIQVRLLESVGWLPTRVSLMRILNEHHY